MGKPRYIKHSQEIRDEAIRLVLEGQESITKTAKTLGVAYTTVYEWVAEAREAWGETSGKGETEAEELQRLRKENHRLRLEQEFLKKAITFFAKESR